MSVVICYSPPSSLPPPLWAFAWQTYAQPGVAEHLLTRQEQDQIWINDWLFALWQVHKGNTVAVDFRHQIRQWQAWRDQVIVPWRHYRAGLKSGNRVSYERAKQAELSLEWHDQRYLCSRQSALIARDEEPARQPAERLNLSLQRLSDVPRETLSVSVSVLWEALRASSDSGT